MHLKSLVFSLGVVSVFSPLCFAKNSTNDDFVDMSFEQLMQVEITSVSKKSEKLSQAAAAVYVVTQDEIRRSGATSIPEALRLVPGVDAAQVDPNKWAIGIRGFNGEFTNKLLVMIDGRSVFSPTFSGVYWENFDYLVKDIERIEIIRGPGATLWGTNAVNGVINIITREVSSTNEGTVTVATGNELSYLASMSLDHVFSDEVKARGYARVKQIDNAVDTDGNEQNNHGEYTQLGGRIDWQMSSDQYMVLHADAYSNRIQQEHLLPNYDAPYSNQNVPNTADTDGGNVQLVWNKLTGLNSEAQVKLNYDYYDRDDNAIISERRKTVTVEMQHQFSPVNHHDVVVGAGYQGSENNIDTSRIFYNKSGFSQNTWNIFAQDSVTFPDYDLALTVGVKVEGTDVGGSQSEIQPNLRASWQPSPESTVWAAVSRANRTPSIAETGVELTLENIAPNPLNPYNPMQYPTSIRVGEGDFNSEQVDAYEFGWRWLASSSLAFDLATFYNEYSDLRSYQLNQDILPTVETIDQQPFIIVPLSSGNSIYGHSQGFEFLTRWQLNQSTNLRFVYNYIDLDLSDKETTTDFSASLISADQDRAPKTMASIWGAFDLADNLDLDIKLFYTSDRSWTRDAQTHKKIDSGYNADVRLAWRPTNGLELSLLGHNLLHSEKQEFLSESWPVNTQLERSLSFSAEYSW